MTSPEIYRTATLMIETYGEMAPAGAFIRADQLRDRGDMHGRAIWLRVAHVAEDLLCEDRPGTAAIH